LYVFLKEEADETIRFEGCNESETKGNGVETKQAAVVKRFPSASAHASASVSASESASACVSKKPMQLVLKMPIESPLPVELGWLTGTLELNFMSI